jgi:hypothetical protein
VDDVEWHLAEQMADRLRMRIEEFESLKLTGQNPSGSAQRLSSFVVYWLTLKARCNSYVSFITGTAGLFSPHGQACRGNRSPSGGPRWA